MNKPFSIYLDAVRITAAFLVYIYHSNQRAIVADILPASHLGHSSVIVFFVLSGFVIAYVTATKENTLASYAASRISRIYSVALPALLLTLTLDYFGRQFYPELYGYPFDQFLVRLVAGGLFANEIWLVSITTFSNVPYWSVCYEMWYYVGFALITFLPTRLGAVLLGLLALALGPKIILLAPLWISGVVLYRWEALRRLSVPLAALLWVVSVVGLIFYHTEEVSERLSEWFKATAGEFWYRELTFSKFFIADYILGILVFTNFAAMRNLAPSLAFIFKAVERPVRWAASYTFTLYLLHQPLFLFWAAVLRGDPNGYLNWCEVTLLVLFSVWCVGYVTEHKRHLLKRFLEAFFMRISARWVKQEAPC